MSDTTDILSKKVYALAIKRTGKKSGQKYNTLMFYAERQQAEEYAAEILLPDADSYLDIECALFECDLYHHGNPMAFIAQGSDCFGVPNFTPTK